MKDKDPGLFDKPTPEAPKPAAPKAKPATAHARKTDPHTSHKAANANKEGRLTQREMIFGFLRSIEPEGACSRCIWKGLDKPTEFPNGLDPRIGAKDGLIDKGWAHRKVGSNGEEVVCRRPEHEGDDMVANFYGPF
jgi:hypothetical protein